MRRRSIERLLPAAYQRSTVPGSVLAALLDVMESLHAPDEEILADVDALFAPYTARADFLPYLTSWVALDYLVGPRRAGRQPSMLVPQRRVRDMIADAASAAQLRGTRIGLARVLELATGVAGFTFHEPPDRPYHFVVGVPRQASRLGEVISYIVEHEKPASATFELEFAGEEVS